MATKLEVINNIMRRLREQEVTSSESTPYSKLIAAIVADAYEEVLDEWNWRPVAKSCYINVPAGAGSMAPDGNSVVYGPVPDGRLIVVREAGSAFCFSYKETLNPDGAGGLENWDEFRTQNGVPMCELALPDFYAMRSVQGTQESGYTEPPTHFAVRPLENETLELHFYPPCDEEWTFAMGFYERPGRLDATVATDATEFDIPFRPVQELALMYALNERGEEMGEPGNLAQGRYIQALSTAKEVDLKAGEHSNSYDWRRG